MSDPIDNAKTTPAMFPTLEELISAASPGKDWEEEYAYSLGIEAYIPSARAVTPSHLQTMEAYLQ